MDRIEQLEKWLADSPHDNFIQHALALEYIKLGRDEEARILFEKLLEYDPGYVGSYYHLAKLLERNGQITGAMQVYQKGMEKAQKAGDKHALNELRAAYEELAY